MICWNSRGMSTIKLDNVKVFRARFPRSLRKPISVIPISGVGLSIIEIDEEAEAKQSRVCTTVKHKKNFILGWDYYEYEMK